MYNKKRKRKIVILTIIGVMAIVVSVLAFFDFYSFDKKTKTKMQKEEETIVFNNNKVETNISNTNISKDENPDLLEGEKLVSLGGVLHTEGIKIDDVVDIRIYFPNGESYFIILNKKVILIGESKFWVYLNQEEMLKLSSAYSDLSIYQGSYMYVIYNNKQENLLTDNLYPVNLYVLKLKGLNEEELLKRKNLEDNLLAQTGIKGSTINS